MAWASVHTLIRWNVGDCEEKTWNFPANSQVGTGGQGPGTTPQNPAVDTNTWMLRDSAVLPLHWGALAHEPVVAQSCEAPSTTLLCGKGDSDSDDLDGQNYNDDYVNTDNDGDTIIMIQKEIWVRKT